MFENWPKWSHSTLRVRLDFEWTKGHSKCKKWSILAIFLKPTACGQIVLPDMSTLNRHKLAENAKRGKLKCDILGDFQTL